MLKKIATNKRLYIALFLVAVVMGGIGYVRNFQMKLKKEIATFDESAWQQAVDESGIEVIDLDRIEYSDEKTEVTENPVEDVPETEASEEVVEEEVEETVAEAEKPFGLEMPCRGEIIGECSIDELVFCSAMDDWRTHNGIDIAAAAGDPVFATADGVIAQIYEDELLGVVLVLDHQNGFTSVYGNIQSEDFIEVGTAVSCGDVIGGVGHPGVLEADMESHLHFELQCNGEYSDPSEYMNFQ